MKAVQLAPPDLPPGIHLNLGCGQKLWDGFVNIDFPDNYSGKRPDVECDIRELNLPDDYADTAHAIHVLEHFHRWETEKVLTEWKRVLKPGGKLVIEVPCLDQVIRSFIYYMEKKSPLNDQLTMWRLYGDPFYEDERMVHKWCFSGSELKSIMEEVGFVDVTVGPPVYHHPQGDMRVTGIK